jgi:hypothetical protein
MPGAGPKFRRLARRVECVANGQVVVAGHEGKRLVLERGLLGHYRFISEHFAQGSTGSEQIFIVDDHNAETIEALDGVHAVDMVPDGPLFSFGVDASPHDLLDEEKMSTS